MACNCVTEKQMAELYKAVGHNDDTKIGGLAYAKVKLMRVGAALSMLLIGPMIFAYVLYKAFFGDGKISLKEFFGLQVRDLSNYV